ncbi:MFS family major facilitator transporter [Anaeromyces robustus]|uniref:MFS family major facilitator transporter n=1 Tax=Anaeromyces robustus TaxID=1754192 RepID=A0A1Y1X8E9_9FUNG|nr:MFS family major facilitator transporter [Anaeromyces robustus]|eukprot:ORX82023.1 MFS family major facilitator transporter [Anaeromyces robustus]
MSNLIKTEGKKVSDRQRTLIFLDINVSCIATSMLATALTTALPPIMEALDITVNKAQWLTTGFTLFLAIITPFTGFLISRFKTKKLFCFAVGSFLIGLIICAFATNFWIMMLGRIIQGCGNGLISSMAQVIIINIYPRERIGSVMGWYGLSLSVAPIVAPTIAGILVDSFGWRTIFIAAAIVMGIAFIFAIFVFEDVLPTMEKKFDVISFIISAFSFGGITLAIGNIGSYKFMSPYVLVTLIIGIIASIIFVWRQLHIKVPFLDIRVLKYKEYTVGAIASFILQLIVMGSAIIIPIYVQQVKNKSATISGLVVLPGALTNAIINPLAGKIYDKVGMKLLFIVGSIFLTLSSFAIYLIKIHHSIWLVSCINCFRFFAIGIVIMPFYTWAMRDIPKLKASDATALFNSIRFIGSALGTALFVSIMTKATEAVSTTKKDPKMYGINIAFLIMAILAFIMLLLGIFGCKSTPKKNNDDKESKNEENNKNNNSLKSNEKEESTSKNEQSEIGITVDKENLSNKKETTIEE